jgi:hypothetical protein
MASLEVGDRILTVRKSGSLAATHVVVNQHQLRDDQAELLLLHLSGGSKLAVTPDHALYVDGALVAASEAKVGSALSTAANGDAALVMRVEKQLGAVINPVTDAGTLLASDAGPPVLAASHPIWIAPLLLSSPTTLYAANAALRFVGDSELNYAIAPSMKRLVAALGWNFRKQEEAT